MLSFDAVSAAERDAMVGAFFGATAVAAVAPRYARPTPKQAVVDILTDGAFVCQARRAARAQASRGVPVYLYEFRGTLAALQAMGPTHSIELWYLFGNEEAGIGLAPQERPLSHLLMDAWGRFARTGDPGAPALPWPRYDAGRDELAVLNVPPATATAIKHDACDFWDRFHRPLR